MMDAADNVRLLINETHRSIDELIAQLQESERSAERERLRYKALCDELTSRQERARLAAATASSSAPPSGSHGSNDVRFVVSGRKFVVSRHILTSVPDSVIAALAIDVTYPVDVNGDGDIILSRPYEAFEVILKYLQLRYDDQSLSHAENGHHDRDKLQQQQRHHTRNRHQLLLHVQRLISRLCPSELSQLREEATFYALDELAEFTYRQESSLFLCGFPFGDDSAPDAPPQRCQTHYPLGDPTRAGRILCMDTLLVAGPIQHLPQDDRCSATSSPQRPSTTLSFATPMMSSSASYMVAVGSESGQVAFVDAADGGWSSILGSGCSRAQHSAAVTSVLWATETPLVLNPLSNRSVSSTASSRPSSSSFLALLFSCGRDKTIRCSLVPLHGGDATSLRALAVHKIESSSVGSGDSDPTALVRLPYRRTAASREVSFASGHSCGFVMVWTASWRSSTDLVHGSCHVNLTLLRVVKPTAEGAGVSIRQLSFLESTGLLLIAHGTLVERVQLHVAGSQRAHGASDSASFLAPLDAHQKSVRVLSVSSYLIASGCFGGKVLIWDRAAVESSISATSQTSPSPSVTPHVAFPCLDSWIGDLQFTIPTSSLTMLCIASGMSLYVTDPLRGAVYRKIDFGSAGCVTDALRCFNLLGPSRLLTGSFDGRVNDWNGDFSGGGACCPWCMRPWLSS